MSYKEKIFKYTPLLIQNTAITIFNTYQYKLRQGKYYWDFRDYYHKVDSLTSQELSMEIQKKKTDFFNYVKKNSKWYQNYDFNSFDDIPILEKKDIIDNLHEIQTISEAEGIVSFTGGTTGASMKVIYAKSNMQERFAILDHFRSQYGYKLGKKTAWFSGKNLITDSDIAKGVCSHYDFMNRIRFYSTFHINQKNFQVYWDSLSKFQPEFIVGFPSSVYEICEIAKSKGLKLDKKVKVFFPTAETILPIHRDVISNVLGCQVVDQYASSEGAPHILQCKASKLHIHPLTGIFEVMDINMQPSQEGELLVTSFTTRGTPLIRYRIGDYISLDDPSKKCPCGSIFPLVKSIEGRSTDYILSLTNGKVNLGNISNSTKGINGIIKFQVIQKELNAVQVLLVVSDKFNSSEKNKFKKALSERFGPEMLINFRIVDDITPEKSGKFRLVKNLLGNTYG